MELVVSETKRNRGIGKQLLQKAIETARNEGCKRIELSSSNWRTDSHRFYMENGFDATHIDLTMDL
jgi:GNAT superfamily N-acetyltransferase